MSGPARVGIPRAVDTTARTFGRSAIDQEPRPFREPLRCGGCPATVGPVGGYPRRDGTAVSSHYRLRRGHEHDPGCLFHFDARAGELVIEHRREIDRHGDHYVLVLRDPDLARAVVIPEPPPADPRSRLQIRPRTAVPVLHPTISAAAAIARLLRVFENDPDARNAFRATYDGRTYTWNDVYFDAAHDSVRLLHTVEQGTNRPLVVRGAVQDTGRSRRGDTHYVRLSTGRGAQDAQGRWINLYLRATDSAELDYQPGDDIIGYGPWKSYAPPEGRSIQVNLWCDRHGATARAHS